MLKFVLKRLLQAIPVLLILMTLTFVFMRAVPGGPFDSEKQAPEEVIAALNARYNFDKPMHVQYYFFMRDLVTGDFINWPSFKYSNQTVLSMIAPQLPRTVELAIYSMIYALLIGITAGVIAALKKNTYLDYGPMSLAMVGVCVPSVLMGPLLALVFGVWLEVLPVAGWDSWAHKILPTITLGSAIAAYVARLSRGGMLEVLNQDYIRTARAKGVPENKVILRHSLKGGLLPVVNYTAPAMAGLLGGSFVTETIFRVPGIGRFYVESVFNRDYTVIAGITVLFAFFYIGSNLIADVVTVLMNPRLKFGAKT